MVDGAPDEIFDATEAFERLAAWVAKGRPRGGEPGGRRLPAAFLAVLETDATLRDAWENGTKLGGGADTSASALDWGLAFYLRRQHALVDGDIVVVLRRHPHGQIGGGKLKGRDAERRIDRIIADLPPWAPEGQAWPEPVDILADPELTGIAAVDETCLPESILATGPGRGRAPPGRSLPHRGTVASAPARP